MSPDQNKNANPATPAADSDWLSRQDDLMSAEQAHASVNTAKAEPESGTHTTADADEPVDRPDYVEAGLAEAAGGASAPKGETTISTEPPVDKNWLAKQDAVLERSGGSDTDKSDGAS